MITMPISWAVGPGWIPPPLQDESQSKFPTTLHQITSKDCEWQSRLGHPADAANFICR